MDKRNHWWDLVAMEVALRYPYGTCTDQKEILNFGFGTFYFFHNLRDICYCCSVFMEVIGFWVVFIFL